MNMEFLVALEDLAKEKGIETEVLFEAIEAALLSAYKRNFGARQSARVFVDRETGEYRVFAVRNIVEEVEDPKSEISLEDARKINPNYELGNVLENEVTPRDFGRIAAQTAKQVVIQRVREAERNVIYEKYSSREGDIITGLVNRIEGKGEDKRDNKNESKKSHKVDNKNAEKKENHNIFIDLGNVEAFLGPNDQIPNETYTLGQRIKAYIVEVKKTTKGPQIFVSRTHCGLLKRLFELEVPELQDGIVELKAVSREPGARSKIAVYSKLPNVDPVGSCVGAKGMRVQSIVNELNGEKIDIIKWSEDIAKYIASSLSPAKVISVEASEEDKFAQVVVSDSQLSLAIGKEGQNARLAAKLTGWKIDIRSETQVFGQLADLVSSNQAMSGRDSDFLSDDNQDAYIDHYNAQDLYPAMSEYAADTNEDVYNSVSQYSANTNEDVFNSILDDAANTNEDVYNDISEDAVDTNNDQYCDMAEAAADINKTAYIGTQKHTDYDLDSEVEEKIIDDIEQAETENANEALEELIDD